MDAKRREELVSRMPDMIDRSPAIAEAYERFRAEAAPHIEATLAAIKEEREKKVVEL